ncbi:hemolysin, lipoprotein (plasmid) [Legionella adelaidensis]|uniref:Hemolysin, lipoprotein n=1 Tax=Legionella adelaidensis TaxID=45056 RepID=A0A0W0R1B2_9GAMM|nr:BON domain-containing protein [Legionella adelaidensis]KTC64855.1 hemolysin, lipoprotein [Legionella adelaidensis]VEH82974.1 hemolysin, lipoprotein [Legionella adelaidensis]
MNLKGYFKLFIILLMLTLVPGCLGTIWTGANLFYDRHSTYKKINDFTLSAAANHAVFKDKMLNCDLCVIDIAVFNGDILLSGHVPSETLRQEAVNRVKSVDGYRRIFNQLSIRDDTNDTVEDTWITGKIRSQIIADADIDPNRFKIVTSDCIVYLMGDVLPEQAKKVIQIAQETRGVRRVVTLFKYYTLTESNKIVQNKNGLNKFRPSAALPNQESG